MHEAASPHTEDLSWLYLLLCRSGKLANPNLFKALARGSFTEQLRGSVITSPLHHLLSPALHAPTLVALVIAFAELAVGLGTLLGLFDRIAALGAMALSLTFFLVVSFHDRTYYYGPDIVFLFAWTPLAISGSGRWSHDDYYIRKREEVITAKLSKAETAELDRRVVLQRGFMAGSLALFGLVTGGITAALGRMLNTGSATTGSCALAGHPASPANNSGATPGGATSTSKNNIGSSKVVPFGGAATFTDPITGSPGLVVHPSQAATLPTRPSVATPGAKCCLTSRFTSLSAHVMDLSSMARLERSSSSRQRLD